jgi:hypothetical protein
MSKQTPSQANIRYASTPDAHLPIPYQLINHTKSLYGHFCAFAYGKAHPNFISRTQPNHGEYLSVYPYQEMVAYMHQRN